MNNTLKAVLAKMGIENAKSYTSHGFRRGAANELRTKGPQWSTVATLGEWRSLAFRGYVDITAELDRDMSKLLAETEDLDSDPEEEVRSLCANPYRSDFGCLGSASQSVNSSFLKRYFVLLTFVKLLFSLLACGF